MNDTLCSVLAIALASSLYERIPQTRKLRQQMTQRPFAQKLAQKTGSARFAARYLPALGFIVLEWLLVSPLRRQLDLGWPYAVGMIVISALGTIAYLTWLSIFKSDTPEQDAAQ